MSIIKSLLLFGFTFLFAILSSADPYSSDQWALKNSCSGRNIELDFQTNKILPVPSDRPLNDIHLPPPFTAKKKIRVAVLDTGIQKDHPDLKNRLVKNLSECEALEKFKQCLKCDSDPSLSCEKTKRRACEKIWYDTKNPEVDLDKNGYPLDCSGWSVLGSDISETKTPNPISKILGRPDFGDLKGHGTHIAGIIAAEADNGVGIEGCSQNVEILPVQVLSQGPREPLKPLSWSIEPQEPSDPKERRPMDNLGDFVARGIYYAIHSGAEVINMSLGWPQAVDSQLLREAIQAAQKRGIIIVAAAGNDSTQALLRPCVYDNVICVGSHNPDGAISHFSNFGAGVDIFAPGLDILSTWPASIKPQRFRDFAANTYLHGNYERLHGSSQATAFVSCAVAEMIARGYKKSEIYPRIVLGSREIQNAVEIIDANPHETLNTCTPAKEEKSLYKKYGHGGLLDIQNSLEVKAQSLILPASKDALSIKWNRQSAKIPFQLKLKNYWQSTNAKMNFELKIKKSNSEAIRPLVQLKAFPDSSTLWKQEEIKTLSLELLINDSKNPIDSRIPSELELEVTPFANGQPQKTFIVHLEISVPVDPDHLDEQAIQIPIVLDKKIKSQWIPMDHILDDQPEKMDYFLWEKTSKEWTFHLMQQKSATAPYERVASSLPMDPLPVKGRWVEDFTRIDIDSDGLSEYVVILKADNSSPSAKESTPVRILVFNHQLKLIKNVTYNEDRAQFPYNISLQIQWMKFKGLKVPTWMGHGQDPNKKPNLRDAWKNRDWDPKYQFFETPEVRLYFLDYEGELHTINEFEGYKIADMLAPTQKQIQEGQVSLLLVKPQGTESKPSYIIDFAQAKAVEGEIQDFKKIDFSKLDIPYRNLLDTKVDYSFDLTQSDNEFNGTFWFYPGRPKSIRLTLLGSSTIYDKQLSALRGVTDSALQARYAYLGRDYASTFILTNSEVQYHELNSDQSTATSLKRYTFIPDLIFENYNFPFVIEDKKRSENIPTLFTNEGSEFNTGIRFVVPHYKGKKLIELTVPARLRFESGLGCEPIDQPFWTGKNRAPFLDFRCKDFIVRYPLSF